MLKQKVFHLIIIKPTRYDDDGYPLQWRKSLMPSNTLACLYGLTSDCKNRKILGENVDILLHAMDESNTRVRPDKLVRMITRKGGKALVMLAGVQTNNFHMRSI